MKTFKINNINILNDFTRIYNYGESLSIKIVESVDHNFLIDFLTFLKNEKTVTELIAHFHKVNSDYIEFICSEFVSLGFINEVLNVDKVVNVYGLKKSSVLVDQFKDTKFNFVDSDTIFKVKKNSLLLLFLPLYEKFDYVLKLSDFFRENNIDVLIFGLNKNVINIGPHINDELSTASFECYQRRRYASEKEAKEILNLDNCKNNYINNYDISNNLFYKVFMNLVVIELTNFFKNESGLLSKEVEINISNYDMNINQILKTIHYYKSKISYL